MSFLILSEYGFVTTKPQSAEVFKTVDSLCGDNYCIIGGMAVVHYTSKAARQVSPDVDILLLPSLLPKLHDLHKPSSENLFGISLRFGELDVDFLGAINKLQRWAIKNANIVTVAGQRMRFAPISALIVLKARLMRNKDMKDLQLLDKSHPDEWPMVIKLTKAFFPDEVDDMKSIQMLIKHQRK